MGEAIINSHQISNMPTIRVRQNQEFFTQDTKEKKESMVLLSHRARASESGLTKPSKNIGRYEIHNDRSRYCNKT